MLIDDTLRSLDGDTLERFMDTLAHELQHTGVIHIGGGQARNPLFSRTLHLIKAPPTHTVGRDDAGTAAPLPTRRRAAADPEPRMKHQPVLKDDKVRSAASGIGTCVR